MSKQMVIASLGVLVLLGAGCVEKSREYRDASGETPENMKYRDLICGAGFKEFVSDRHNIEFCYPEDNDEGEVVTLREDGDGVILSVDGEPKRKVEIVEIDPDQSREEIVLGYALAPEDAEVTCGTLSLETLSEGQANIILTGEKNGEQTLEATTQCTFDEREGDAPFNGGVMRSGTFIFYDREPEIMYILSGEQYPSLGIGTDAFVHSIQPQRP
ncbi:hypothetical protein EBT31_01400 [bacterium]|nr:hypothetical protein [bacterium]NBX49237.1 hypothetical protein [bacterium]